MAVDPIVAVLADCLKIPELVPTAIAKGLSMVGVENDTAVAGIGATLTAALLARVVVTLVNYLPASIPVWGILPVVRVRVVPPSIH